MLDMADGKQEGTLKMKTAAGVDCVVFSDVPKGRRYYPVVMAQSECTCELLEVEHSAPVLSSSEREARRIVLMRKRFEDVAGKGFLA